MLLEARQFLEESELKLVKITIDFVCNLQFSKTGNFPPCIGEREDKLVHWCHGGPGIIHMLALAYKTFSEPKYLQIASKVADDIWIRGLLKKGNTT